MRMSESMSTHVAAQSKHLCSRISLHCLPDELLDLQLSKNAH